MSHCVRPVVIAACLLAVGVVPLHAQETDTSATDTVAVDEVRPDTTDRDTTDTVAADTVSGDTTRAAAANPRRADSLAAIRDSMQARRDSLVEVRKTQARTAAEDWLALIDAGQFKESWDVADTTLQKGVSREDWDDQGRRARGRLDTLRRRTLTRAVYRDSTTQIPGGHPVVFFQYETAFDLGEMLEAVVTTRRDTAWRVAGYRVVPFPDTTQADTVQADTTETDTTQEEK